MSSFSYSTESVSPHFLNSQLTALFISTWYDAFGIYNCYHHLASQRLVSQNTYHFTTLRC